MYVLNRKKILLYLGYAVALLTLISLLFLSQASQGSHKFERFYQPLLISATIGISFLVVIVIYYLKKIFTNRRKNIPGTSLSITILLRTGILAFIPIFFISFFAIKFLRYEFQSSFDEGINDALNNAVVLSNKAMKIRANQLLVESHKIAYEISSYDYSRLQRHLDTVRNNVNAYELTVLDEKGFIQSFASQNLRVIIPSIPTHDDFVRVESEQGIFYLESDRKQFSIRTLVPVNKPNSPNYYLQSIFYIPDTISDLTDQINQTIKERDKLSYLMPRVNQSFILVLLLVILLSVLLLMLSSISFAGDMSKPIRSLIQGTKRVSRGNFNQPVLIKRNDDFGTLMQSFNAMTDSLKNATSEAEHNRKRVEHEHAYLATVINSMTSAVITLDYQYCLQTYNDRAETLLEIPLEAAIHKHLISLPSILNRYKNLVSEVMKSYKNNNKSNEIEIDLMLSDQSITLIANVTPIPATDELHGGYVVIFDVLSEYLQQQKQAAWEEVARRLAHEIKNPLTPIQLAAERLNYKLSGHLEDKEQQILSRSITSITTQVTALKDMVNDFSDFAKPSKAKKEIVNFSQLTKEIFNLYDGHYSNVDFDFTQSDTMLMVNGDKQLLRQTIHNIIKNAIEACEIRIAQSSGEHGHVSLSLQQKNTSLELTIEDNGIGLTLGDNKIFEPYVTTKEKGTGLGLAIVKKIIHDHKGSILLQPRDEKGTIATIQLPLALINNNI